MRRMEVSLLFLISATIGMFSSHHCIILSDLVLICSEKICFQFSGGGDPLFQYVSLIPGPGK